MAKLAISLPFNFDESEIKSFLEERNLTHVKTHSFYWFQVGDALKTNKGVMCRVVERIKNEVQEPFIIVANNKLNEVEMSFHFDNPSGMSLEDMQPEEIKCPSCGSFEYDTQECAECGYSVYVKGSGL